MQWRSLVASVLFLSIQSAAYADTSIAEPVRGNPSGNVTVYEFFDYQCGHCKISQDAVNQLLSEDRNVKVIYKDYPKLGPLSVLATKAALASTYQGGDGYFKLHDFMMSREFHFGSEDALYQAASQLGLDVDKLKKDMASDAVTNKMSEDIDIVHKIGVTMVPTFVIGGKLYPGEVNYARLKEMVEEARATAKQKHAAL